MHHHLAVVELAVVRVLVQRRVFLLVSDAPSTAYARPARRASHRFFR